MFLSNGNRCIIPDDLVDAKLSSDISVLPPFLLTFLNKCDLLTGGINKCLTTRPLPPDYLRCIQRIQNEYFKLVCYLYNNIQDEPISNNTSYNRTLRGKRLFNDSKEVRRVVDQQCDNIEKLLIDFEETCTNTILTSVYEITLIHCEDLIHTLNQFKAVVKALCR